MSKQMPEMPAQIVNIHKATLENIEFAKKQQWQITNYTALIYVGLFGLAKSLGASITTLEKMGIGTLTLLTFGCAVALLIQIQGDTGRYRARLEKIHNRWLTEQDKVAMNIEPYVNPALRGVWFLMALIGVAAIGAAIVIYSLSR